MNVIELLEDACARNPTALALVAGARGEERTLTFGELAEHSRRLAGLFGRAGLEPGDAAAIFMPPSLPLYVAMAAVLRTGLIAVFVEPSHWRQTLEQAAGRLSMRVFLGTPLACALRWFVPELRRIPNAFVSSRLLPRATSFADPTQCDAARSIIGTPDESPALLTFTSGSTGRPKGVLRSHGLLLATHSSLSKLLELHPGRIGLTNLPFIIFANLAAGMTTVIPDLDFRQPAKVDAKALVQRIRDRHVTSLVTTPYLAQCIADFCTHNKTALDGLTHVYVGGAPVFAPLLDRLSAAAPRARIGVIYGATEAEPIAAAALAELGSEERQATCEGGGVLVGRPPSGISVRVIADAWGDALGPFTRAELERETLPRGGCGEIVVCGPNVSRGYLGGEGDRNSKISVDGELWHRTGDAGHFDRQGRLWLAGRCTARIDRDGRTSYSLQAEAALAGAPGVARAALVQTKTGRIVLVVQSSGTLEQRDAEALASRLKWCRPDEIVTVRKIPLDRRHHAKVSYADVLAQLERGECLGRRILCADRASPGAP